VVRYPRSNGYYTAHLDSSEDRLDMSVGAGRSQIEGERVVTVLTHLTEGFGGGATEFSQVPSGTDGKNTTRLQVGAGSGTKTDSSVRNNAFLGAFLCQNYQFTKTGSGQT
jgi:hypothetical protein